MVPKWVPLTGPAYHIFLFENPVEFLKIDEGTRPPRFVRAR